MNMGYQKACDSIRPEAFRDNWLRTFRGIPDFSPQELDMMKEFVSGGEYVKLAIYLTDPKFGYEFDADTAEFIIREMVRGDL